MTTWQLARYIPKKAFSIWNQIPQFFKTSPLISSSGAVITSIKDKLPGGDDENTMSERKRRLIEQEYGLEKEVQIELEKLTANFIFKESTVGANEEALQCVRKGAPWLECDDYTQFAKNLAESERRRGGAMSGKIRMRAYFAESDVMIGKTGQKYFENCFKGFEDVLDFKSATILEENHDSVAFSPEVLGKIFRERNTH